MVAELHPVKQEKITRPYGYKSNAYAEFMVVTPELAEEWLKNNQSNRPLSNRKVQLWKKQMEAGKWMSNGESIKFDIRGNLLDGQHRLTAILESGISIEALVVIGLPRESFHTIDVESKRSAGDILAINGFHNQNDAASIAKMVLVLNKGLAHPFKAGKNVVDHYDILKFAEENEGFQAHVDKVVSLYKKSDRIFKASEIGGLMWLMKQKDKEAAIRFWATLTSGVGIEAGSVYLKLRNKFSVDRVASERMTNVARLAVIIKAWNAVTSGKNMTVFKHRKGDDFPTIK